MKKVVVILSGGLDSSVLLHSLYSDKNHVAALSINYGQRHARELQCAEKQAKKLGLRFKVAQLEGLRSVLPGSSQTDQSVPVPHGHYEEANMKATVVPNRNMILLSVAIGYAISLEYDTVAYAAHAGDHAIYPDCRPEFATAMENVAHRCHYYPVHLIRPFILSTKAEIVRMGQSLGVDFTQTYSCYEGREVHCGRCGTCVERIGAFLDAGVMDPTVYADKEYALSVLYKGKV